MHIKTKKNKKRANTVLLEANKRGYKGETQSWELHIAQTYCTIVSSNKKLSEPTF